MKRFRVLTLLFFLTIFCSFTIPKPVGYVNDFGEILTAEGKAELNFLCKRMKEEGIAEYAILIIKRLDNADVKAYAQAVFDNWKIGEKGKDNGLLLVISLEDRKIFIQTGYGLEGTLTDGETGYIIDKYIIPEFKKSEYEKGIIKGSHAIYEKLKNNPVPAKKRKVKRTSDLTVIAILFFIFVILNIILRATKGYRGIYRGGGFGGFGGFGGGGFGGGGFGGFGGGSSGGGGAGRSW